jgi:quercetin dioxygenase-like cupin family protein
VIANPIARPITLALLLALLLTTACAQTTPPAPQKASVAPILATATTILGQPITYPEATAENTAEITAVIVTLPPGVSTGLHRHPVPLFGYMLEGELTVTYEGPDGDTSERIYRLGDALMEAVGTPHDGRNTGTGDVRILAVFIGADGIPNSEKVE